MSRGIPSRKLVLGFPSFARSFTLVDSNDHGIGAAVKGPGDKGEFTLAEGLLAFYEVIITTIKFLTTLTISIHVSIVP